MDDNGRPGSTSSLHQLVRRYAAAWGDNDRAAWLHTFAANATQEDPIGEGIRHGRDAIGGFWDGAMAGYDTLEIHPLDIVVTGNEAAMYWQIVARAGDERVSFDGIDVFTFTTDPLIASVRAYWERDRRHRSSTRPDVR